MSADANPWVPPRAAPDEGESAAVPATPVTPPWQRPHLDAEAGGIPTPTRRLGWWRCPRRLAVDVAWWAVGVHGGAGVTRLVSGMAAGGYDVSQHWPVVPAGVKARPLLLVARTDQHGLRAAQDAIREWFWRLTPPGFDLAGLVLMADAPGKLPPPLRNQARTLAGSVPRVWHIPWVEEWRFGEQPERPPKELTGLREHLTELSRLSAAEETAGPAENSTQDANWNSGRSSA
ncbi:MAG: hypothetical protein GEV07_12735 [Streptosporangiales bacterium]|nr:hypothetical protein [Streptosporangiales bacterium]